MYMKNLNLYSLITLILSIYPATTYPQDFYKWVDASGSTHYSATPPPSSAKKLGSVSTYSNSLEQNTKQLSDNKPVQNLNQPPFPVTPKDKLTAKERAEIEAKVRKGMQDYSKEKRTNPYIDMFGSLTEQDLRSSLESEYLQKKEKLANSRASNR
ncbi:DUF4124 domain-containing protein [Acinetobacter modestus]|uniref:DUF4124 domain-containing protein n=1 Tax=Acinetobacter modestus TaxID=1776740 RepID=UPI001F4AB60C|nr:DUF4124 domain-containing protein [Acinetobacter modestus]MCH7330752.1 DUF4124 domain-containing protein [Acinetobacter modestus]